MRCWRASSGRSQATCEAARRQPQQQHRPAGQAGHHAEHAVRDGGGEALLRPQPHRAEPDGGDGLPRAPSADVERQRHDQEREHEQREELRDGRGGADGAGGHDERREVAGERNDGEPDDPRRGAGAHHGPHVGGHRTQAPAQQPSQYREHRQHEDPDPPGAGHELTEHAEQGGLHRQHHRGHSDQHDQTHEPFEHDGPHTAPDVTGPPAVPDGAVQVAEHPGRQHGVEEQGLVAVGDGPGERQAQTQAARHQAPAPRAADRGDHPERECGEHRPRLQRGERVQDGRRPRPPREHADDRGHGQRPGDACRAHEHVSGRASRSACPTTTRRSPWAAASSLRRM
ncbi:hypothetical protein GCM10023320_04780 [Pseudonocardia adelaidensis]|uniref:Uncharacterized protein n=1 Tax=Pseudonocardia adelaidensis TaxID=648754 RepID=A0ABP9NA52_9PSEU